VRVFRVVLVVVAVVFIALAFFRLNVRQINRTGLCGSILQGPSFDDGGSSTPDCNHLRHDDTVAAVAFGILGVAALGVGVSFGHTLRARNG
jgi:hypothetical protein